MCLNFGRQMYMEGRNIVDLAFLAALSDVEGRDKSDIYTDLLDLHSLHGRGCDIHVAMEFR